MLDYRVSDAAQRDIENLTGYTAERFGELALDRYLRLLDVTITKLRSDPERPGIRNFSGKVRKCHLSLWKEDAKMSHGVVKHPRHVLFFQIADDGVLEVIRVLHDSMDFASHLPGQNG
ncbi:MAG: type II toxin-antitoxin system RelE/ParE family toxin [Verrucomicrobiae bacterium]|nr:type II toxin-antitoxin system RelE/ParE family toxin [Verrucomicrobiae bacterium]